MLKGLGSALKKATDKIAGAIFIDQKLIDSVATDLQRALIQADIDIKLVSELTNKIREAGKSKIKGIEKKEQLIKFLHDEIQALIGKEKQELKLSKKDKILFIGLYGTGKTTTIAKLAKYYKKRGKGVALLGLDVHRPAAPEQLEQLGKQIEVPVFIDKQEKDPIKIYEKLKTQIEKYDLVLIDSAGRAALEKSLITEIKNISKTIKPTHTLLVLAADIGQTAKKQIQTFKESCNINGVIITRMDSSAKAGGALTACAETKAPIYFIGTGEHMQDIETFNPKNFISRILGIGDLETLIEKVKSATDEKKQKQIQKRAEKGELSLLDVVEQSKSLGNMGGLDKIKSLIPGFGAIGNKIPERILDDQEKKVKKWEHIVKSMTPEEIKTPELLEKQTSRISRIAKGSGTTTTEIRSLLKQYKILKDLVKSGKNMSDMADLSQGLSQKQIMKLAKKFGKKKMMRF